MLLKTCTISADQLSVLNPSCTMSANPLSVLNPFQILGAFSHLEIMYLVDLLVYSLRLPR